MFRHKADANPYLLMKTTMSFFYFEGAHLEVHTLTFLPYKCIV